MTGALCEASVEAGIEGLRANAERHLRDAKLLFAAERYPSAAMLAAMALDEMARIPILLDLAAAKGASKIKRLWAAFHEGKVGFPWVVFHRDDAPIAEDELNSTLDLVKRLGRSVDCLKSGNWTDPASLINRSLAEALLGTAERICGHPLSGPAVRLWIETSRSMARASPSDMIERYRATLVAHGLRGEATALTLLSAEQDWPANTRDKGRNVS
jgi:hypothetical protein